MDPLATKELGVLWLHRCLGNHQVGLEAWLLPLPWLVWLCLQRLPTVVGWIHRDVIPTARQVKDIATAVVDLPLNRVLDWCLLL